MSVDPARKLKKRFGAAIDWRVRDAVERVDHRVDAQLAQVRVERADDSEHLSTALADLGASLTHISATLTEQQRALADLLEQLDRRVTALEQR